MVQIVNMPNVPELAANLILAPGVAGASSAYTLDAVFGPDHVFGTADDAQDAP